MQGGTGYAQIVYDYGNGKATLFVQQAGPGTPVCMLKSGLETLNIGNNYKELVKEVIATVYSVPATLPYTKLSDMQSTSNTYWKYSASVPNIMGDD